MSIEKYLLDEKSLLKTFEIDLLNIDFRKTQIFCVDFNMPQNIFENIKKYNSKSFPVNENLKIYTNLKIQIFNEINACLNNAGLTYVVNDKKDLNVYKDIKGLKVISYDEFKKKF